MYRSAVLLSRLIKQCELAVQVHSTEQMLEIKLLRWIACDGTCLACKLHYHLMNYLCFKIIKKISKKI